MIKIYKILLFILLCSSFLNAKQANEIVASLQKSPKDYIIKNIQDNHTFYGLASYFNNISYYLIDEKDILKLDTNQTINLKKSNYLAVVGRFNVLLIQKQDLSITIQNNTLTIHNPAILSDQNTFVKKVLKSQLLQISPTLDQIRYFQLYKPLAILAKFIESLLLFIYTNLISNWGITVIIFALFLKLALLPVSILTSKAQKKVSQIQVILTPKLAQIKMDYDGEEAHHKLMQAHKDLAVSPFFTLKPMLGLFIQIPILIATFNALGEMPQFSHQSFIYIKDLTYPDGIMTLSFVIPSFGDTINLLPFLMTLVTIYSTMIFKNKHALKSEVKKQKTNLYLMALVFFILFYPFPSVMVFYWTLSNILHIVQQRYMEI